MNVAINKAIEHCGSQTALANACGVSQNAVSLWLNGGGISAKYIPRIVKATKGKVSSDELLAELEEQGATGKK